LKTLKGETSGRVEKIKFHECLEKTPKMPPGEETHKRHICYFSYPGSLLSQPLCHSYIIQGKSEGVIKYKQPITNESTGTISE
jgi:hypothetical protein